MLGAGVLFPNKLVITLTSYYQQILLLLLLFVVVLLSFITLEMKTNKGKKECSNLFFVNCRIAKMWKELQVEMDKLFEA